MLQSVERPLCAAGFAFLDRRAWHRRVGAIDAAVPFERFQNGMAGLALIEPLTGVRGHRFFGNMSAFWACKYGLKIYFVRLRRHSSYPVSSRNAASIGNRTSSL